MHDFVYFDNWFDKKYRTKLDGRWATMKMALNLARQRGRDTIFETGCQRMKDDWGAGCSTTIFCEFVERYGGHLCSVDNNERHLKIAEELTRPWEPLRTLVLSDSVAALKKLDKLPGYAGPPGIVFLDSYDYPIGEIWNAFGGKTDLQAAIERVAEIPEAQLLSDFGDVINPCQEHCLNELLAALPFCDDKTVILIDDTSLSGGGKGRTAGIWLCENGYECLLCSQQAVFVKASK